MDIVDAQVHLNAIGAEAGLAVMDALGIRSVLIDEFDGVDEHGRLRPFVALANGATRAICAFAQSAAMRYPERLGYLLRIDPRDPELDSVVDQLRSSPNARALRVGARSPEEIKSFWDGAYRPAFEAARAHGFPMFVLLRNSAMIEIHAEEYSDVTLILDHCGAPETPAHFDKVLELARYSNIALKWAHAPFFFAAENYPFRELDLPLRHAIDAFGANRIMWASDATQIRTGHSWAETLFHIRDNPTLSQSEKEWILGGTARALLDWHA